MQSASKFFLTVDFGSTFTKVCAIDVKKKW